MSRRDDGNNMPSKTKDKRTEGGNQPNHKKRKWNKKNTKESMSEATSMFCYWIILHLM